MRSNAASAANTGEHRGNIEGGHGVKPQMLNKGANEVNNYGHNHHNA